MVVLIREDGQVVYTRRLFPAKHSLSSFNSRNGDKAAKAATFQLSGLFDELPFFLRIVGKHFRPEWYFAGTPRRNVLILFGHHLYGSTKQDNELRLFVSRSPGSSEKQIEGTVEPRPRNFEIHKRRF
jgi:hypothetical protein